MKLLRLFSFIGYFIIYASYASAGVLGWVWNQPPPQYASVGDTFEVSATYYKIPSGEASEGYFCISNPNFDTGFDPNGARISWGAERTVNGKFYKEITITQAGNGVLYICAGASGASYSFYGLVTVRTPSTTLSSVSITGKSTAIPGQPIQLGVVALSTSGQTLTGGTNSWTLSPVTNADITSSGLLTARDTIERKSVSVTAAYTYLGITKRSTNSIDIIPIQECFTTNSPTPIPYLWLDSFNLVSNYNYEIASTTIYANGYSAWKSYLAGLIPTNPASKFRANISITNGIPLVSWTPNLESEREYLVWGKDNMTDTQWITPISASNRFFRVEVK